MRHEQRLSYLSWARESYERWNSNYPIYQGDSQLRRLRQLAWMPICRNSIQIDQIQIQSNSWPRNSRFTGSVSSNWPNSDSIQFMASKFKIHWICLLNRDQARPAAYGRLRTVFASIQPDRVWYNPNRIQPASTDWRCLAASTWTTRVHTRLFNGQIRPNILLKDSLKRFLLQPLDSDSIQSLDLWI